jgi:hypothetical protein
MIPHPNSVFILFSWHGPSCLPFIVVETTSVKECIYVVVEEMPGFKLYIQRNENPEQSKQVMYV